MLNQENTRNKTKTVRKKHSLTPKQEEHLEGVQALSKSLVEGAFTAKASASQAIKAKCLECSCYDRDEVKNCTVEVCPLWRYRPYQDRKAVREIKPE